MTDIELSNYSDDKDSIMERLLSSLPSSTSVEISRRLGGGKKESKTFQEKGSEEKLDVQTISSYSSTIFDKCTTNMLCPIAV